MSAAMHTQCRSRVNRALAIQPRCRPLSAVAPIADKLGRGLFVRKVPISDKSGLHPTTRIYSSQQRTVAMDTLRSVFDPVAITFDNAE
jgi:hypothetical protein